MLVVRKAWDEGRYNEGQSATISSEDGFSTAAISQIAQSSFFLAYWDFLIVIQEAVAKFMRWAEGCPCHWSLMVGVSSYRAEKNLRMEISCPDSVPCRCPLMGTRADQTAQGKHEETLNELLSKSYAAFVAE